MRHWLGAVALIAVAAPAVAQTPSLEERLQRQQALEAQMRDMLRAMAPPRTEIQSSGRQNAGQGAGQGSSPQPDSLAGTGLTRGEMLTVPLNSRGTKGGGEPARDQVQGRAQPTGTASNVVLLTGTIKPQNDAAARAAAEAAADETARKAAVEAALRAAIAAREQDRQPAQQDGQKQLQTAGQQQTRPAQGGVQGSLGQYQAVRDDIVSAIGNQKSPTAPVSNETPVPLDTQRTGPENASTTLRQPPPSNSLAGNTTLSGSSRADLLGSDNIGVKRPGGNASGQTGQDDGAAFVVAQGLRGNSGTESRSSHSTGNAGQGAALGGWQAQVLDGLMRAGEIDRGQARDLADAGGGRGAGGSGLFDPLSSQQLIADLSRALAAAGLPGGGQALTGAASQYVTALRDRGVNDTTSNFASENRVMQATDPWDDFVHYNANEVSVRPTTALNGTTTATYNGRALGAFNGGETLDGKLTLNVDLSGGTLNGSLSFNGGASASLTGTANVSSLSINSIGGTGFGGVWEATMSGKYYGSRGQEVGGSWDLEVTSGARTGQVANGSFAAKQ